MSATTATQWEAVIGLEVHCQLKTRTKLFCGCRNAFGEEPNTLVCPVCSGQPGAMPVFNEEALVLAVRVALALGCEVAEWSKFDRKNYFYCDLPKGYQVSQFDRPYCTGGGITLSNGRRVRLARIHLEEDAGKAIHDRGARSLVDLNRAGVPLIESVTEPDLRTPEEAFEYLTALKEILQYAGASDCDMEKGSLRCDVNVSVREPGGELRTKVELKNLNSFSNVKASLEHEIERQVAAYEAGDPGGFPVQETRLYDPSSGRTRTMRSKEDAHDYRYFPEPDLPRLTVDAAFLEARRAELPELASERRARYAAELGLSEYDAGVLTAERAVSDFFEGALAGVPEGAFEDAKRAAKAVANLVSNAFLRLVAERPDLRLDALPFEAREVGVLAAFVGEGRIGKNAVGEVLEDLLEKGGEAAAIVQAKGLEQVSDEAQLVEWCRAALEGREAVVADVRAGNKKALGALMGPVMQASGGRADAKAVRALLQRLIDEGA